MDRSLQRVVATQVYPSTVSLAQMMIASWKKIYRSSGIPLVLFALDRDIPFMKEDLRIDLDMQKIYNSLHDRVNRGVNDKVKAIIFEVMQKRYGTEEVLYIDADCLIYRPIDYVFKIPGRLLMAEERLDFYAEPLRKMGCEPAEFTLNGGVMLMRENYLPWWCWYYEESYERFKHLPNIEGQFVWNVVWHKHRAHSEVLPQKYNQLHVKHGPHGAFIYHFAGLSQNMKEPVMRSCLREFYGDPI